VVVFFPLKRLRYNRKKNTLKAILVLTLFALVAYSHVFFTSGFEENDSEQGCVTLEKWFNFVKLSLLADSLLSIIIPFILIATINLAIASKLVKFAHVINVSLQRYSTSTTSTAITRSFDGRLPLLNNNNDKRGALTIEENHQSIPMNELNHGLENNLNNLALASILNGTPKEERLRKYFKSTRMLFVISITFLVLNSPLALCKIRYSLQAIESYFQIKQASSNKQKSTANDAHPLEEIIERITCYLYYSNFTLNIGFYILSGSKLSIKAYLAKIWSKVFYRCHL
jgi:hypothetical protein